MARGRDGALPAVPRVDLSVRSWPREAVCGTLAVLFSHYLMHYHLAAAVQLPFADLTHLLEFRAPKPFCYRVFTPACLRLLTQFGWSPEEAASAYEWGALVALYYLFRAYLREFLASAQAAYAALAVYFVVPFVFIVPQPFTVWFPWDVPSVCFFLAGLHLLYRERWVAWYGVLLVGTLNRETTAFLIPIMVLALWQRGLTRLRRAHIVASAALWVAVKGVLAWSFRNRSGPWVAEWNHRAQEVTHWRDNLGQLADPTLWPYLLSALGFLWILAWHLRKQVDDSFLRSALAVVPLYFACVFLFANIAEHRIYADLIPVVLAPVLVVGLSAGHSDTSTQGGRKSS